MIGLDKRASRNDARESRSDSLIRFKHKCKKYFCKDRFSVLYG